MDQVKKSDIPPRIVPGRKQFNAFGADAYIKSMDASMAYCRFSPEFGRMESHCHDNEILYVVETNNAVVTYGDTLQTMNCQQKLEPGMLLRMYQGEWHRFDFTDSDGYVEFITFFAVPQASLTKDTDIQ